MQKSLVLAAIAMLLAGQTWTAAPAQAAPPCQMDPSGWCPGEKDDPCGRNHFVWSCKLDSACFGVPYTGESAVACKLDERGFGLNCPTVGCTSRQPK